MNLQANLDEADVKDAICFWMQKNHGAIVRSGKDVSLCVASGDRPGEPDHVYAIVTYVKDDGRTEASG